MRRSSRLNRKPNSRNKASLDVLLASLPSDKRAALQKLRQAVHSAAPDAEEGISYGLPAFRLGGRPLVAFAAAAKHCSFYPMSPAVIRAHEAELAGYETSKGTIRFTQEKPLPTPLVRKLVRARVAELAQKPR
jgi:uncharacterized protein YdhG (YjbR/CyaY superfamily)